MRMSSLAKAVLLPLLAAIAGCETLPQASPGSSKQIDSLRNQIVALENEVQQTRQHLRAIDMTERTARVEFANKLEEVENAVDSLPSRMNQQCKPQTTMTQRCDKAPRTIELSAGKAVLGELEEVWLAPPGVKMIGRIDTGATSSSLHADEVVEFERDGEDWVRFQVEGKDGVAEFETAIVRQVRVVQQADPKGTRRPVVELRVRIGDIDETVEFTLADRSHLDNSLILGRNFLKDLAVVDVARRFIQPAFVP